MRYVFFMAGALFCVLDAAAQAQPLDGTWNFTRSVDHGNVAVVPAAPQSTVVSISGDMLKISATCTVHLRRRTYYAGGPFQGLLKSGQSEASIAKFMQKSLDFDLNGPKTYYETDDSDCNKFGDDLLVNASQLIAIRGGEFFYEFEKQGGGAPEVPDAPSAIRAVLKTTSLPFILSEYTANCNPAMVKGVPTPSAKCAPAYYYHVATRASTDAVSKLVGEHDYQKGGARFATEDYNSPVNHGLHPVFLVFPPMNGVTIVRVDDFESRNEQRDTIAGAYLAIKDGKVTDEINFGCDLDVHCVCSGDGQKVKLTAAGRFEPLK